jgi:hypothetical protein
MPSASSKGGAKSTTRERLVAKLATRAIKEQAGTWSYEASKVSGATCSSSSCWPLPHELAGKAKSSTEAI